MFIQGQDTLYLKHVLTKEDLHLKNVYPDSMFTKKLGKVVPLDFLEDSVIVDFNNGIYAKVKKFYIVLNKRTIVDSCSYYFWMKNGKEYIPFFVLGSQIIDATSGISFSIYTYRNKLAFWKKSVIGFVVSLNQGFTGLTGKVKNVGERSSECTHIWGRNVCELTANFKD